MKRNVDFGRILFSVTGMFMLAFIIASSPSLATGQSPTHVRNFIFGHSLIVHDPPAIPTPSNETTVPHWLHFLAQAAGNQYSADGQYGFLPQHATLPPQPQWGFQHVAGLWDTDSGMTFAAADFNAIMLTAGNFIQGQPASEPYDSFPPTTISPLSATLDIVDWVSAQEPGIDIYIYENWPEMGPMIASFPPTAQEFAAYNQVVVGDFHDWWVDYHGEVMTARPAANVQMIPVGPIISEVLTETVLSQIPVTDLYEDADPHGRPTLYFLASLITYMTIYGEKAPADFVVPNTVHSLVQNNYGATVDTIWDKLVERGVVMQSPTNVAVRQSTADGGVMLGWMVVAAMLLVGTGLVWRRYWVG